MRSKTMLLVGCAVVWALSVTAALAEGEKRVASAERVATCAKEARGLKGEELDRVVSECLKDAENPHGTGHSQQQKMKDCNAEAGRKELHGDERRLFMSACLRG